LALGFSFLLAALYVKFRDISYIWEVVLQAGFYATPIIYPLSMVPSEFVQKILLLNPMAMAIQDARFNVVTQDTITASSLLSGSLYILVPLAITTVVFTGGVLYFRSQANSFAENL
jgi:ABC-2 type transport system permease protein